MGLHDILSPIALTLKVLGLTVSTFFWSSPSLEVGGLCDELETMAGRYMLEALSIEFLVSNHVAEDSIGPMVQQVERVLVKPRWSALRHVSFNNSCWRITDSAKLSMLDSEVLQSQLVPINILPTFQNSSPSLTILSFHLILRVRL